MTADKALLTPSLEECLEILDAFMVRILGEAVFMDASCSRIRLHHRRQMQ
jgi:hypothetical protein